jgi:hypothetical protein
VQQYLTIWDWVLSPLFLGILILFAKRYRNRHYPAGHPLRKYYLPGLYVRFAGAILITLIYVFYYGGGDTTNYYDHARVINSALNDSFDKWTKLIFHVSPNNAPEIYTYTSKMYWYNSPSEYTIARITSVFGLFTFNSFIPIALLFAFVSYTGIWAMYKTFVQLYPKLKQPLAYAFLFIPSTVIWGSGVFKDTICIFALGWLTYSTFRLFINRDISFKNFILIGLSFYLVAIIKLYILIGFIPALVLWLLLVYSKRIKTVGIRWLVNLFLIGITIVGTSFLMQRFAEELNRYSLERLAKTAETTRAWTNYASGDEGSAYNIGEIDGTLQGMLGLFPKAIVVTLFRPFPWEVKKVFVALSSLEALIFIYFTLQLFIDRRSKPAKLLFRDPNMLFCLVFTLIFAFAVGASSGNFGALSRYKIPCLPFYGAMLAVMLGDVYTKKTRQTIAVERKFQQAI